LAGLAFEGAGRLFVRESLSASFDFVVFLREPLAANFGVVAFRLGLFDVLGLVLRLCAFFAVRAALAFALTRVFADFGFADLAGFAPFFTEARPVVFDARIFGLAARDRTFRDDVFVVLDLTLAIVVAR
jgi:hypothetical protein